MLARFELSDGQSVGIMTDDASSHYLMTHQLQSTPEASGIEWPALRNHIPCMAHVMKLAVDSFMSSLGVKGRTKSWEAHEHDQQFGENEHLDIGKSQRLLKEGNARINKVSSMRLGLAKIIEKVHISRYFESPETDLDIARNACWIDYADTWLSKRVHWVPESPSLHHGTIYYGCEEMLELNTGGAWASRPITIIRPLAAQISQIQWLMATLHNTGWMDHCQVRHGCFEAILILDPVDVQEAYGHIASRYHSLQWHVWSYGSRHAWLR